jgi:hypothetical protein
MFSSRINYYLLFFGATLIIGYISSKFKSEYKGSDDYDIIKKYILNESPLYGNNKPKIWVHTKYEVNARRWKDFYSRNTTDLNQPYIHLTIKTIINHCGEDFNVCLVDDETFSKLIPSWNVDMNKIPEPFKTHFREVGMLQLVYHYGGMIVPNSFICLKNLKDFYLTGLEDDKPFVCENVSRTINQFQQKRKMLFNPDIFFMGAKKGDTTLGRIIEEIKLKNQKPHFEQESDFMGYISFLCSDAIENNKMNLVLAENIGLKTNKRKPILLDDMMEEQDLDLSTECVGIYIPGEEVLTRTKYQWFAVLPGENLLNSNIAVARYLKASLMDADDMYTRDTEIRSVVSI